MVVGLRNGHADALGRAREAERDQLRWQAGTDSRHVRPIAEQLVISMVMYGSTEEPSASGQGANRKKVTASFAAGSYKLDVL